MKKTINYTKMYNTLWLLTIIIVSRSKSVKGGFGSANLKLDPIYSGLSSNRYSPRLTCVTVP